MILAAIQLALQVLMFFLDPKRVKREEFKTKAAADLKSREGYAKALVNGDTLTVAAHLDSVLREARAANIKRRQDSKKANVPK